jgi:hypothetical protein
MKANPPDPDAPGPDAAEPGAAPRPKSRKALVAARVDDLLRIMLDGAEECWDWCEYVREKQTDADSPWFVPERRKPLSYSQIRRYVGKVDKLIAASCRASRKKLLRRHLAKRRNLYAKAVSQGDIRAALACLQDEAELTGLYPPRTVKNEHSGPKGGSIPMKHDHGTLCDRIEQFTDAFLGAAAREEKGAVPGDGAGEPVDPGADQGRPVPQTG